MRRLSLLLVLVLGVSSPAAEPEPRLVVLFTQAKPVLLKLDIEIDGKPLDSAWSNFVGVLFDSADTNKDGTLDEKEQKLIPPTQALFGATGAPLPKRPSIDLNSDKKVTKDELAKFLEKQGAVPFDLGGGSSGRRSRYLAVFGRGGARGSAEDYTKTLFALLDADKNGRLSKTELESAEKKLAKKDADGDEIVTADELRADYNPSAGDTGEFIIVDSMGYSGLSGTNTLLFATNGKRDGKLASRLLNHYRRSGERTPAGTLSPEELQLSPKAFAFLDTNKNGLLTTDELVRFGMRDPDLVITLRIGDRDTKPVEVTRYRGRPIPADSALAKIESNLIMKVGQTNRLNLGLDEGSRGGQFRFAQPAQIYEQQFAAADRDNNDYLDSTEAQRIPFFASLFTMMDVDSDGQLFLKEVKAYVKTLEGLQAAVKKSSVTLTASRQGRGFFDLLDKNRDSRLSVRELRNGPALLAEFDLNEDEELAKHEIPIEYHVRLRKGVSRGSSFGSAIAITAFGGPSRPAPKTPREGPKWFVQMDRNADGDVSKREFLGPAKTFAKIDADGDALIDVTEAKKADALFRER